MSETDPQPEAEKTLTEPRKKSNFQGWIFFLLLTAGLLFRVEYLREYSLLLHFKHAIGADVAEYFDRSSDIINGMIFPQELSIHAPLYPFFLAFFRKVFSFSIPALRILQVLLNYASIVVLFFIAGKYRVPRKVRLFFLIFAMLTPTVIFHQAELISESLLLPLMTASLCWFYAYDKSKRAACLFLSGATAALLVLTHGLMLSFVAALVPVLLKYRTWKSTLIFISGLALVIAGCIAVNSIHYRKLSGIQGNAAFNIFLGNNPAATGGCYLRPYKEWRDFHKAISAEAKEKKISENRLYLTKVLHFYIFSPLDALKLLAKKFSMLFAPWELVSGADPGAFVIATAFQKYLCFIPFLLLFFTICGIGRIVTDRKLFNRYLWCILPSAFLAAALVLTVVSGRYRLGMMPGVFLIAAIGAVNFNWKRNGALAVIAAITAAVALHPGAELPHEAASINGEILMKLKRYDEAEKEILFAMKKIDDPSRFNNMLGNIAELRNDPATAERHYLTALAAENDQAVTYLNLGQLLFRDRSRRKEACAYLQKTLALNPVQGPAWNFLGIDFFERRVLKKALLCFVNAHKSSPGHAGYKRNMELCSRLLSESANIQKKQ